MQLGLIRFLVFYPEDSVKTLAQKSEQFGG